MKKINQYILEKFKLNSKNLSPIYKFNPKDKGELINTIIEICKKDKADIVDLNIIDTSKITDMSYVFCNGSIQWQLDGRNIDISDWNVSNVTDFHNCFEGYLIFDCDLSKWDVSKCYCFRAMFMNCLDFTGKGLENWDMKSATDISHMFQECKKLDIDLSKWDLQNCRNYKYVFTGKCNLDKSKKPKINGRTVL